MKEYEGAVAFIDILGIGALTGGRVPLTQSDFSAHKHSESSTQSHHGFAAKLLVNFRRALLDIKAAHTQVNFAQLSDSAFMWSTKPLPLTNAARALMWNVTQNGILCSGGLAYGGVIEPDRINRSIGAFVLGEAATKAVHLEGSGKGCRLFSDDELPAQVLKQGALWTDAFQPIKNPLDSTLVDEFRWYLHKAPLKYGYDQIPSNQQRLLDLMDLVTRLRFSPHFRWNTSTEEGLRHVATSVEALSRSSASIGDGLDYTWSAESITPSLHSNRSDDARVRMLSRIQEAINDHSPAAGRHRRKHHR
jgi:hypothetical protein